MTGRPDPARHGEAWSKPARPWRPCAQLARVGRAAPAGRGDQGRRRSAPRCRSTRTRRDWRWGEPLRALGRVPDGAPRTGSAGDRCSTGLAGGCISWPPRPATYVLNPAPRRSRSRPIAPRPSSRRYGQASRSALVTCSVSVEERPGFEHRVPPATQSQEGMIERGSGRANSR